MTLTCPLALACDASAYGIEGVLLHMMQNGEGEKSVDFASLALTKSEQDYDQVDGETLPRN